MIKIQGEIYDARPLLGDLNNEKKSLSKKFNGELQVNFKEVIVGPKNNLLRFSMIGRSRRIASWRMRRGAWSGSGSRSGTGTGAT